MKLPNGERAIIDQRKLDDYCLSPTHGTGRHKARVFAETVGLRREDSATLLRALKHAAEHTDCEQGAVDQYGQRFTVDFELDGPAGSGMVRSVWIVHPGDDAPRLVTCYVL